MMPKTAELTQRSRIRASSAPHGGWRESDSGALATMRGPTASRQAGSAADGLTGGKQLLPIFLSIVVVFRNRADLIEATLAKAGALVRDVVTDYEIVVIDNASDDDSLAVLERLTREDGQPNLQVFALAREVDGDNASWVGLENALGDFVVVVDLLADDLQVLPNMLEHATRGADLVFVKNLEKPRQPLAYRAALNGFGRMYKWLHGVQLVKEGPHFRVLSRRVINFILQHPQPAVTYRHLPAIRGFSKVNIDYRFRPPVVQDVRFWESVDLGLRLLVSTTRAPMRLVTGLAMFGALANMGYCIYIIAIALLKPDVQPGWVSLSLQQSGMFLLISVVLLVLSEYVLQIVGAFNAGPAYSIGREFNSVRLERREKLNLEEVVSKSQHDAAHSTRAHG